MQRKSAKETRNIHREAKKILKDKLDQKSLQYLKLQQSKTLKADEEPTVISKITQDDITEELSLAQQIKYLAHKLTNKDKQLLLNLATQVQNLQEQYDLLADNIITLSNKIKKS